MMSSMSGMLIHIEQHHRTMLLARNRKTNRQPDHQADNELTIGNCRYRLR